MPRSSPTSAAATSAGAPATPCWRRRWRTTSARSSPIGASSTRRVELFEGCLRVVPRRRLPARDRHRHGQPRARAPAARRRRPRPSAARRGVPGVRQPAGVDERRRDARAPRRVRLRRRGSRRGPRPARRRPASACRRHPMPSSRSAHGGPAPTPSSPSIASPMPSPTPRRPSTWLAASAPPTRRRDRSPCGPSPRRALATAADADEAAARELLAALGVDGARPRGPPAPVRPGRATIGR